MVPAIEDRGVQSNQPNGGDRTISNGNSLQYACIFPLQEPVDPGPACADDPPDNPACNGTAQIAAVTFPSLRPLAVAGGLGERGVPASICPGVIDSSQPDFGYERSFDAIVDRVKHVFARDGSGR